MTVRNRKVTVRLSEKEKTFLNAYVKKSGLSLESYLRHIVMGRVPKETPPLDYYTLMRELHSIGTNINQIAKAANATGEVSIECFTSEAANLRAVLLSIQRAIELPEKIHGDH